LLTFGQQAIDEYWAIIRRTKEGLHLPGTQKVIGGQFKRLLETHREAFFVRLVFSSRFVVHMILTFRLGCCTEDRRCNRAAWYGEACESGGMG